MRVLLLFCVACTSGTSIETGGTGETGGSTISPEPGPPTGGTGVITVGSDSGATPVTTANAPALGAHALAYYRYGAGVGGTLTTAPITTSASGSMLVVSVGRGDLSQAALPTDSAGNTPYQQLDTDHTYTRWPYSGTSVYAFPGAVGGPGFTVTTTGPDSDETTLAVVEVANGGRVSDVAWTEVTSGPLQSGSVTTSGPATLVAFWWGDADGSVAHTAVPDGGFTVVDAILDAGSLVQCAVAVETVADAGTYDVTWTATPTQGAQLWLVAVE